MPEGNQMVSTLGFGGKVLTSEGSFVFWSRTFFFCVVTGFKVDLTVVVDLLVVMEGNLLEGINNKTVIR